MFQARIRDLGTFIASFAVFAITACTDDADLPLEPAGDPLFSNAYISRDLLTPEQGTELSTGAAIAYDVTAYYQRAPADTAGAQSMEILVQVLALDRANPADADVRFVLDDTTLVVTEPADLVRFEGISAVVPACEGVRFVVVDLRFRNRLETGTFLLGRDMVSYRTAEATEC